jgi:hypothetical protein
MELAQLFLNDSKTTFRNLGDDQALKHGLSISGKGLADSKQQPLFPIFEIEKQARN